MAANSTAVWRVRPSGSNTNGGGYDSGIASAGTDRSQQDAAYLSNIGTVSTATVTLTDTGAAFTTDLIGNGIYVAGTSITTTFTFITGVPSSTTLTLQTSPGTAGTAVTYHIGGGWADFWTNTTAAPLVAGNTVYILGSGTPNPASYTFDYTYAGGGFTTVAGSNTAGNVTFANDPSTPGYKAAPDTTGGMPCIKTAAYMIGNPNYTIVSGLWFVASSAGAGATGMCKIASGILYGCVFDQNSYDVVGFDIAGTGVGSGSAIGCEVFSYVAPGGPGSNYGARVSLGVCLIINCNIHDCVGYGIFAGNGNSIIGCVIAKNRVDGIYTVGTNGNPYVIMNNTIDANAGNGINIGDQLSLSCLNVFNNIISNHVTAGKYGIVVGAGTTAANDRVKALVDYNTFYNNNGNYNAISAGSHDTATGSDPYTAQSTENYTLI